MQRLFNKARFTKGKFASPALDLALARQKASVVKLKAYYRKNYANDGIDRLSNSLIFTLFNYVDKVSPLISVSSNLDEICSPLGITTGNVSGDVHDDVFSKQGTVYLSGNHYSLSELSTIKDYRNIEPLRFLSRDGVTETLLKPNTYKHVGSYAAISVDVVAYTQMVRLWLAAQSKKPEEEKETTYELVNRYVYPNMMDSAMDCAIVNMYAMDGLSVEALDASDFPTVIGARDYTEVVLKEAQKLREQYFNKSQDFNMTLADLPAYTGSVAEVEPRVDLPETTQAFWGTTIAYINYANMAMLIAAKTDPELRSVQNILKRIDRKVRSEKVFDKIPNRKLEEEIRDRYATMLLTAGAL